MAKDNKIKFYDLQLSTGSTISPFVWATKYAIKHKGFDLDIVPGGFTGIMERTEGNSERLPAIQDDGKWVLDSWLIAEYLDETYPDRPRLINGPGHKVMIQGLESWLWKEAIGPWMGAYIHQYYGRCLEVDKPYILESRGRMLGTGQTFDDMIKGREERLPKVLPNLELLRGLLADNKWLGGETPDYGDYRLLAVFLFLSSVADIPALTADDPLRDWVDRGFDLYNGLGRHPGQSPIFGLELREGDPEPFSKNQFASGLNKRNTGPASTAVETARMRGTAAPATAE